MYDLMHWIPWTITISWIVAESIPLVLTRRGRKYLRRVEWVRGEFGPAERPRSEWYAEQAEWRR